MVDDIFFSNINFYTGNLLTEEELNSSRIDLTTPQGNIFKLDDTQKTEKTIHADIKINGKGLSEQEQLKWTFYWFKENSTINTKSEKYNYLGGESWECLNEYSIITQRDQTTFVSWAPATNTLIRTKSQILAKEEKYKCVAVYQDQTLENTISLKNISANYEITLETSDGEQFYYNYKYPSLICKINGIEEVYNYSYVWSVTDNQSQTQSLPQTTDKNQKYTRVLREYNSLLQKIENEVVYRENVADQLKEYEDTLNEFFYEQRVSDNRVINIDIGQISDYNIYKCSVYYGNSYIGTASFTIYNRISTDIQNYVLKITNAEMVYKYDEQGISPCSQSKENPLEITPLSFNIYNSQGEEINENLYSDCEIEWLPPTENTLMIPGTEVNNRTLDFSLEDKYSDQKTNNLIQLKVTFKGQTFWDSANLSLLKEGELGTNGTQYVCKILPNTSLNINIPIVKDGILNYTPSPAGKWFKVQLWKNGSKIFEGVESGLSSEKARVMVQWSILKNKYSARWLDPSSISYTQNNFSYQGYFEEDEYGRNSPANIVKCTVTYDNKKYYSMMPIVTIETTDGYDLDINTDGGFYNVLYSSEGTYPSYRNIPFEIFAKKNEEGTTVDISQLEKLNGVTYDWRICGQVYDLAQKIWTNIEYLKVEDNQDLQYNQKSFIPNENYDGECVSAGLECNIISNLTNKSIGKIHIPIYFYLNRYTNSALNDWDGNKIEIDEEGSYVLTPQMGAGKKEDDNSFTGMLMGVVKDALSGVTKTGLLGYNKGEQSIFLDSETGGVILGKGSGGQIIIDPKSQKSYLFSHNYWKNYDEKGFPKSYDEDNVSGNGLLIDLATPEIRYGNKNFWVDKDGNLTCGEMITSDGVLTQLNFSGVGQLGCSTKMIDPETRTVTETYSGGGTSSQTYQFPNKITTYPIQNLISCYIPKGFKVWKATAIIEHADGEWAVNWAPEYAEGTESLVSTAVVDTVKNVATVKGSATDNIGVYLGTEENLISYYTTLYEGQSWTREIDQSTEVLLKSDTGFRNVVQNPDDYGKAYMKTIDFTDMAKLFLEDGKVNYIDIRTIDPGREMTMTPWVSTSYVDTSYGTTRTYTTWRSSSGNYTRFSSNEATKQGFLQATISFLGYYDPDKNNL